MSLLTLYNLDGGSPTRRLQVPSPTSFNPRAGASEAIAAIPAAPGIYSLSTVNHPPHISWSINLRRRLNRLLVPSYTASSITSTGFAGKVISVSYWRVASRLESALLLYQLTRESYPDSYLKRLHLRMPWFIGITSTKAFGRLQVSNRLGALESPRFGPFRTRDDAELYQEHIQSLYQLRRCTDILSPSPDHPGCIYGEMNQCLRPCQCAVSPEEYATETARVSSFLQTAGKSDLQALSISRDRAAAELDFEEAAFAHKRIEKMQAAISTCDKVVASVEQLNGLAVTRSVDPDAVNLWPILAGYWQLPLQIQFQQEIRSLDTLLRERLQTALQSQSSSGNRLEQVAVFSRWYYSSWRDGDWLAFDTLPQLNYRRLVKMISNLLKASVKTSAS